MSILLDSIKGHSLTPEKAVRVSVSSFPPLRVTQNLNNVHSSFTSYKCLKAKLKCKVYHSKTSLCTKIFITCRHRFFHGLGAMQDIYTLWEFGTLTDYLWKKQGGGMLLDDCLL